MNELKLTESNIPGLLVIDLVLHKDSRGSFREVYQAEKLKALGLPELSIVQQNISYNKNKGATRGYHAEPWDKYVHIAKGKAFAAWVDLRAGPNFGKPFSLELNEGNAVFVPKGVANSYQTLEDDVVYSYLVTGHYNPNLKYDAVNIFDPEINIKWPVSLDAAEVSDKDRNQNPLLSEIEPINL